MKPMISYAKKIALMNPINPPVSFAIHSDQTSCSSFAIPKRFCTYSTAFS